MTDQYPDPIYLLGMVLILITMIGFVVVGILLHIHSKVNLLQAKRRNRYCPSPTPGKIVPIIKKKGRK